MCEGREEDPESGGVKDNLETHLIGEENGSFRLFDVKYTFRFVFQVLPHLCSEMPLSCTVSVQSQASVNRIGEGKDPHQQREKIYCVP